MIEEIQWDISFSESVQWVVEQEFHSHNNTEGDNGITNLADIATTLRRLTKREEDLTMFTTSEETNSDSGSDEEMHDDHSVHSNHRPNQGSMD